MKDGMFEALPDTEQEDDKLAQGTIAVDLRDAADKPIGQREVMLGIIKQSVAKGDSREHRSATTSDSGTAVFAQLDSGSATAYRVTVPQDGATFAARPFQLPQKHGMHVVLHLYPVSHSIESSVIVMQSMVYVELRDDRIQLQEALSIFNFGKNTWVPEDIVLALPEGFTALTSQQQMNDQGIDPVEKRGARLRGTFGPGRHQIEFRWQVPYDGASDVDLEMGVPPHMATTRVMVTASQRMKVHVDGFPEAMATVDGQGNHVLDTQKEMRREDPPLKALRISLRDIPGVGPARIVATALAGIGVVLGLAYAMAGRRPTRRGNPKAERQRLLRELAGLSRAHTTGDVGPKTYERARREIIDEIARTLV